MKTLNRLVLFLLALVAMIVGTMSASAQTDIAQVLTTVDNYQTTAVGIGIAILLFVIGRRVIKKFF